MIDPDTPADPPDDASARSASKTYLTAAEVAELTQYSRKTVYKFANLHEATKKLRTPKGLKGFRPLGGPWRFHIDDVHRFMRE